MDASSHLLRCACIKAIISFDCIEAVSFLLHRGNNLVLTASNQQAFAVAALSQRARYGCFLYVLVASRQQLRCCCIEAASRQQSRCGYIELTSSLWLHRISKLVVVVSRQQSRCSWIEPTLSLLQHEGNNLTVDASS